MLKICKVLMFGAVLVIATELKAPLMAADQPTITAKSGPLSYEGKVLVVDRAAKTVTVEIQKRLYLFKFGPSATVVRKGKKVRLEDVVAGQQITLQLIQTQEGEVQIASVDIGNAGQAEAAGKNSAESGTLPADNSGTSTTPAQPASGSPKRPNASPYN